MCGSMAAIGISTAVPRLIVLTLKLIALLPSSNHVDVSTT